MLQYFIIEQTFFNNYIFQNITDTSHIPSTITLAEQLSTF